MQLTNGTMYKNLDSLLSLREFIHTCRIYMIAVVNVLFIFTVIRNYMLICLIIL